VIPSLLISNKGLVKGAQFNARRYVGDPINAVKIFNEKEVDELILLDIGANSPGGTIDFKMIEDIVSEAFIPIAYGGGVSSLHDMHELFRLGVEKVVLNSVLVDKPELIREAAEVFGSQAVSISIDVRKSRVFGQRVHTHSGTRPSKGKVASLVERFSELGAGEFIVGDIALEGQRTGYDLQLIRDICAVTDRPVVAAHGAGSLEHMRLARDAGASAATAGSIFVFHGKHDAVLITYPGYGRIQEVLGAV